MDEDKSVKIDYKIKVAYAEDHEWFAEPVKKMLEDEGFEIVVFAGDGQQLIDETDALSEKPDVFLTDLNMPKLDGLSATAEIIKRWPGSKVVVLSSEIAEYYINQAKMAGALAFLDKTINYDEIGLALQEIFSTGKTRYGS